VLRGGLAVLVAGIALFAGLDALLWPELFGRLLVVRAATLALLAPALPAFFGRRAAERLEAHAQAWLLYVAAATLAGLSGISWIIFPALTGGRAFAAVLALNVFLSGLYGATGLRFRYAAGLGLAATGLFLAGILLRATPTPGLLLAFGTFGFGANAVGLVVSRSLERSARRAFLRARELADEQARSEALLLNVMPRAWAERLETGASRLDRVPDAAVLFATVTGFAEAAAGLSPLAAVELLDAVVARLDALVTARGAERIKTVGATYIAAVGVTGAPAGDPAADGAALARAMVAEVEALAAERGVALRLRVGLATGPLVVGVIGRSRYAFDCWGDTVNTAARLDAAGEAGRVLTTAATAARVGEGRVRPRGPTALKGKGVVETAWVDP
jgi:class 3 adenylate cyclase